MKLHPLLKRNDAGEVVIRWSQVVVCLGVYVLVFLIAQFVFERFVGGHFRIRLFAFTTMAAGLPSLLLLYVAKRHAEGKSAKQFSLSALLAGIAVVCCLLALLGSERRADLDNYAKRKELQKAIMAIVGNGTVHVSSQTLIQVKRPAFNDGDLEQIIRLKPQLDDVHSPLYNLDLSSTSVTDQGIATLTTVDSLEYLFLERTAATDISIDSVEQLPNIKVFSAHWTAITPERLLKLSIKRPLWDIEPKTYQRLKAR